MMFINVIMIIVGIYLLLGLLFAIPFVIKGVTKIDPDGAHGTQWGFRIIIIPGTIVFWPILLLKWVKSVKTKSND